MHIIGGLAIILFGLSFIGFLVGLVLEKDRLVIVFAIIVASIITFFIVSMGVVIMLGY